MKVFITPAIDQQIFGLLVGENMMLAKSWQCIIDHCGKTHTLDEVLELYHVLDNIKNKTSTF